MSDALRSTRKNPTAGARTPTTAPVASARRMNSRSSMLVTELVDVGRVVPDTGESRRWAVVDDAAADEDDPVDDVLDRAELVRDVEDRDPEALAELLEEEPERLLRCGV